MTKTPEQMAEEYADTWNEDPEYRIAYDSFLAGYKAAQDQLADTSKVITYDYVETASNEAKELITKFELKGDEDVLVKALVAAYCRGVDAVDGYLRNSLSAYRNSVKQQQWISVKDRLPEDKRRVIYWHDEFGANVGHYDSTFPKQNYHWWSYNFGDSADFRVKWWMPLPAPPKEEK